MPSTIRCSQVQASEGLASPGKDSKSATQLREVCIGAALEQPSKSLAETRQVYLWVLHIHTYTLIAHRRISYTSPTPLTHLLALGRLVRPVPLGRKQLRAQQLERHRQRNRLLISPHTLIVFKCCCACCCQWSAPLRVGGICCESQECTNNDTRGTCINNNPFCQ